MTATAHNTEYRTMTTPNDHANTLFGGLFYTRGVHILAGPSAAAVAHGLRSSAVAAGAIDEREVVIESLTGLIAAAGASPNDGPAIARVFDRLAPTAERACVILIADATCDGRPRGSVAAPAAARAVLTLERASCDRARYPDSTAAFTVRVTKDRDGEILRNVAAGLVLLDGTADTGVTSARFVSARTTTATIPERTTK